MNMNRNKNNNATIILYSISCIHNRSIYPTNNKNKAKNQHPKILRMLWLLPQKRSFKRMVILKISQMSFQISMFSEGQMKASIYLNCKTAGQARLRILKNKFFLKNIRNILHRHAIFLLKAHAILNPLLNRLSRQSKLC